MASARSVTFAATSGRLPEPLSSPAHRSAASWHGSAAGRARLGLPAGVPVLLVFGGSQEVKRLNDAVAEAIADLVERCSVVHIAGAGGIEEAESLRATLPTERRSATARSPSCSMTWMPR